MRAVLTARQVRRDQRVPKAPLVPKVRPGQQAGHPDRKGRKDRPVLPEHPAQPAQRARKVPPDPRDPPDPRALRRTFPDRKAHKGRAGAAGPAGPQGPQGDITAGVPPREIAAGAGGVYTLRDAENEIHVDVTITHNARGTRTYTDRILRAELTAAAVDHVLDGRNPNEHAADNDDRFVGFSASIDGNNVTLASGTFQGTIAKVWGIVSGAEGPQGPEGPEGPAGPATDLTVARAGDSVTVESSSGDNAQIPAASDTEAGVMSAADKTAVDNRHDSGSSTADAGVASRDHERISALEALTQGLALRDHEVWADVTGIADFALHVIPSPVRGLSAELPGYPWAATATVPADGQYILALRLRIGRHPNWLRIVRDDDAGVLQEVIRGDEFHYAGLEQGGFDYYIRPASAMVMDDDLTMQWGTVDAHTEYRDRVTELVEHEADPGAHQDSPRRQSHLGLSAPSGRRVYLTDEIRHPINEGILEVAIDQLGPTRTSPGGIDHDLWLGASVLDFSGDGGPVATADQSGFPAFMNVARIAGIWQGEVVHTGNRTPYITIAVRSTLQPAAPTFLHLNIPNDRVTNPNDRKVPLVEHSVVTVGGNDYRLMRATVGFAVFSNVANLPSFRFALEFAGGFLQPDGSVDIGVTHAIGEYESLGNGQWQSAAVEDFAREATPFARFPESRYNLRDGQLVYGLSTTFTEGVEGALGANEWSDVADDDNALILNFSGADAATAFLQKYPLVGLVRINDDEHVVTVARVMGSDTALSLDFGKDVGAVYAGGSIQVRARSELVSRESLEVSSRGSQQLIAQSTRRYPQQVIVLGRFTDASLVGGVPPTAPDVLFDDVSGPTFAAAGGPWSLPAMGVPAGVNPLWRAEASFRYLDSQAAWGHGPWIYSRQESGALLFATNGSGRDASDVPPANWTHFAYRYDDGSLSSWIRRGLDPVVEDHLFYTYRNWGTTNFTANGYSATDLNTARTFNIADYHILIGAWTSYGAGDIPAYHPPRARMEDRVDQLAVLTVRDSRRGQGMLRAAFGGPSMVSSLSMYSADHDQEDTGIATSEWPSPGANSSVSGAVIDFSFYSTTRSRAAVDRVIVHPGSFGSGRFDLWGLRR